MNVTMREIMELTVMKDIRLVAGEDGLDNVASWIYFAEHYKVRPWLNGGEIVIYSTVRENLKEESIKKLLLAARESESAAIMIYINDTFPKIPDEIVEMANDIHMPLFEVPWEIKVVQLTKEISNYIIKSNSIDDFAGDMFRKMLLGEKTEAYLDELTRLSVFGDIHDFCLAAVMILRENHTDSQLLNFCKNHFQYYLSCDYQSVCVCSIHNVVVIYASVHIGEQEEFGSKVERIVQNIAKNKKNIVYRIGVSSICFDKRSLTEAFKESIDALKYLENADMHRICYSELGIEKVFYDVGDIKKLNDLYDRLIGVLRKYDKENDDNLYETLIAYLNNNCDIKMASEQLFIHKNSMRYRIKKIEGITGKSFAKMEDVTEFYNAKKIGKFLKKESREV